LIGQEYELRKKKERGGGDRKSEEYKESTDSENQTPQNEAFDPDSHKTASEIAEEHGGQIPGSARFPQSEGTLQTTISPKETAEALAEEHGVSPRTPQKSNPSK
jgi:3-mercaptopyruvate sulfurtransferase SseA